MKKTKYCQNIGPKHLRNTDSLSKHYCTTCYSELKQRYDMIEKQGGCINGLRAARAIGGGSFGYEKSKSEKEQNLSAFFHYVMLHIPKEKATSMIKDIVYKNDSSREYLTNEGPRTVKISNY